MADIKALAADHPEVLDRAVSILKSGGLIAVPTDTVYGLVADVWNGTAVSRLYEVKRRSQRKSIPVLVSGEAAIEEVAVEPSQGARALAREFWPGPLTMVLNRKSELPVQVSATSTVGVRAPNHEFVMALLRMYGPLAATSANPSGQASARTAAQVTESLHGKIDLIVDGGETAGGVPSTVVDLTTSPPALLRQGPISIETILMVWQGY